ncbi:MAG: oxidoreductase [Gammaproteobacteria bacterium]|nr:oxidoreductase [Gammaproteobacteria bacterium]
MIILDTTIVTVALPSIVADLHVSPASLTWILNAYMLTFGGLLLVSGRLGDLYGRKRMFLAGVGVFTLASLLCGLAQTYIVLLVARAVQGVGAAIVMAMTLSLITNLFVTTAERAKAMGIYGLVCAGGGGVGDLLGGLLTSTLSWHWVFLINLPIGIAVGGTCSMLLSRDAPSYRSRRLDVAGALTITIASTLLVYALVFGNETGWRDARAWALLALVGALLVTFVRIEQQAAEPMIPLWLFGNRNVTAANVLAVLWASGTFAWFVISALYMQRVLGYDAFATGVAFLPATAIMAAFSAGLSAKVVMRVGIRTPLCIGLLLVAAGLALFARTPLVGTFAVDVLPGMLLLGLGSGMASTPLLLAATNNLKSEQSGLASGMVNTSFMMGGALGLGVLASLADMRTGALRLAGTEAVAAINGGYHFAFFLGALVTMAAAVFGRVALRPGVPADTGEAMSVPIVVER